MYSKSEYLERWKCEIKQKILGQRSRPDSKCRRGKGQRLLFVNLRNGKVCTGNMFVIEQEVDEEEKINNEN